VIACACCKCDTTAFRRAQKSVSIIGYSKHYGSCVPTVLEGQETSNVLKDHFGQPRWIGEDEKKRLVAPILDCFKLEL
jgi:hypothetical protein